MRFVVLLLLQCGSISTRLRHYLAKPSECASLTAYNSSDVGKSSSKTNRLKLAISLLSSIRTFAQEVIGYWMSPVVQDVTLSI